MELEKIDLSAIAAVGHNHEQLGLLIDRGDELEYIEVEAPIEAYEGLHEVAELAYNPEAEKTSDEITPYCDNWEREYYENYETVESQNYNGVVYEYKRSVEIKISESFSVTKPEQEAYLADINYDNDNQCLRMEFDDGSVYEYDNIEPETWQKLQNKIGEG